MPRCVGLDLHKRVLEVCIIDDAGVIVQRERLLEVLNRMIIVSPDAAGERRDRGYVYHRLECWRPALQDLADYLEREPAAPDMDEVRARVVELSQRCARLN